MTPYLALSCHTEEETERLGRRLGEVLRAGDLIRLEAPLGTGKTALARGLIRAFLGEGVEVPSPTFTLVQEYEGAFALSHADLYRLEDPAEVLELGLDDALDRGAVLVEWPGRGEGYLPEGGLLVEGRTLADGGRVWRLSGDDSWRERLQVWS